MSAVLCKHVEVFVTKDVSFEPSVAVVRVLTECYPSKRYNIIIWICFT